jgi:hypothetical protein
LRALTANGNFKEPKELCFTEGNEENQELSASLTSLSSVKSLYSSSREDGSAP